MDAEQVVPGLWSVKIRFVNAYLLDTGDGLALIDTGIPGSAPTIQQAVRSIGRDPADIRHILVTHCHSDHSGSLAEMKRVTKAPAAMHPVDAAMVREGRARRPLKPAPGLLNAIICRFLLPGAPTEIERAEIEHEVQDGETLAGRPAGDPRPRPLRGAVGLPLARARRRADRGRCRGERRRPDAQPDVRGRGRGTEEPEQARRPGVRGRLLRPRQADQVGRVAAVRAEMARGPQPRRPAV